MRGHYRSHLKRLVVAISALVLVWVMFAHQRAESQTSLVSKAYAVSPTTVALEIVPPPVTYSQQVAYEPTDGDRVRTEENDVWLRRGNRLIGALAGPNRDILYPLETYEEPALNLSWLGRPNSYRLTVEGADNGTGAFQPIHVYRKTKPVDMVIVGKTRRLHPKHHTIYLEFPSELETNQTYTINFMQGGQAKYAPARFDYRPQQVASEAVHVSQIGFRPDDPVKVGFLSTWMGTGGGLSYPEGLPFSVIDNNTNEEVFSGATILRHQRSAGADNLQQNSQPSSPTDVYQMDFSSVSQVGEYRLCVDTVGCSMTFRVDPNVWLDAFYVSARGFYHQRSGIALGAPYTNFERPRPFHPDDGLQVFHSTTPLVNTRNGLNAQGTDRNNFANLIQGKTDDIVPNAWGGYFDAGDWDRRIQHLEVARGLLELLELFPDTYASLSLDIPESNNDLPDLLDETLWGIDVFKRMQTDDGGIRGGIESAAHPRRGETSWQESQTVMAYAPGAWSSYIYAGVTARAARVLQTYAPDRAEDYRQSALRAMGYAENAYQAGLEALDAPRAAIESERALAALELYQLTAESDWHSLFVDAVAQAESNPARDRKSERQMRDIAFLYARLPNDRVDIAVQQRLRNEVLRQADRVLEYGATTDFGWTKTSLNSPIGRGGGLGSPKAMPLLRAYALSGDSKYLQASILVSQYSAGANPMNSTFTTGLGDRSPQHPLIVDKRILGVSPPPGITIYGPIDPDDFSDYWLFRRFRNLTTPTIRQWPTAEMYFDVHRVPAMNEFTVMTSMLNATYTWGYLAARS